MIRVWSDTTFSWRTVCVTARCVWSMAVLVMAATSPARGEDAVPHASPTAAAVVIAAPPSKPAASADASSATSGEDVEPLDVWVPHSDAADAAPSPVATFEPTYDPLALVPEGEEELVQDPVALQNTAPTQVKLNKATNPLELAQRPRRIKLIPAQEERLRAAAELRRTVIREQLERLHLLPKHDLDSRGAPEMRLCSVAVDGYGSAVDIKKLLKAAKLPERAETERRLVANIKHAGCDVVALQGYLAVDTASGEAGLEKLAGKLTAPAATWKGYLGDVLRESIHNAFLVNTDRIHVDRVETLKELHFVPFGPFSMEQLNRLPMKLTVTVEGKDGAATRKLVIVNAQLRNVFSLKEGEKEAYRMQMADVVRQSVRLVRRQSEGNEDAPIEIVAVDRQAPGWRPTARILDGRARLVDFTETGGCSLEAPSPPEGSEESKPTEKSKGKGKGKEKKPEPVGAEKIVCQKPIQRGQELIGILGDGIVGALRTKSVKVDGATKKVLEKPSVEKQKAERIRQLSRYEEIYLFAEDTPFALASLERAGRYRSGALKMRPNTPHNPLVWVELNW